jgi:hypothetical protein
MTFQLLGPSHLHHDEIRKVEGAKELLSDISYIGYKGIPIWSSQLLSLVDNSYKERRKVFLLVPDFRFMNSFHTQLKSDLFISCQGSGKAINKELLEITSQPLIEHGLKCLDYYVETFPHIKLMFWCWFTRTEIYKSESIESKYSYRQLHERYKGNSIDIRTYSDGPYDDLIRDKNGHPSIKGYNFIKEQLLV